MADGHANHRKEYYFVFFMLAVLTAIEIWVPDSSLTYKMKAALLTFLACVKAFMVAWSFMHLKSETKWLWFIAAIPLSAGVYALVVGLETYFR